MMTDSKLSPDFEIMTPGPTQVAENVLLARSMPSTNPDLDPLFYDYYRETCQIYSRLLGTENESLILAGEGILGLEAACASLTQKDDRVLVLDNGVFGRGFADFVAMYGGKAVVMTEDDRQTFSPSKLRSFLEKDHDFVYATLVHCDTPSGMCNDIASLCSILHEYDILTVVDSVAAMFGEPVDVDRFHIDILLGASQKAISAPPGLTTVTVSQAAWAYMEKRTSPIPSFYANLMMFRDYYAKQWFPYTMPISDIRGLRQALENIKSEGNIVERHQKMGTAVRKALVEAGIELYGANGYCGTVTAFCPPQGIEAAKILKKMKKEQKILLAASFGQMEGKVIRIGHMGENCRFDKIVKVMRALDMVLADLGVNLSCSMEEIFRREADM